ncbi:3-deoxy-manno-octulosonate cytidylyltransferase [Swingsia samuiensis]|uniref:3-deoxy-manno-octulosonate cytidylyltransferase n=1 Tax=Swingsia samuiensis TaxID=1293412 RepID=A0A4Y6UGQ1_9PROT|nr:3-deoxy-manno-octulosonate cytidylyltransferase [Swingsia samuiensis]QDH16184.1 3-deoxy-manno-octulosonate cytidylyltransferase [Swingsia samuiensis]
MQPIIIIPSRLASTRLPRKPLAHIGSLPMIAHVVKRAQQANIGKVVVAAGDQEILDAIEGMDGVLGVLTESSLPSGSDRVYDALQKFDPLEKYDVVINLQGDLPLIKPDDLRSALKPLEDQNVDIGTLVAPIKDEHEKSAPQVVKVACDFGEKSVTRALYFSRSLIPWGEGTHWHHVGVYAWRRAALKKFISLPPSGLEKRESLEQLRALEAGMSIGCAQIEHAPLGVDTPEDLERVRGMIECR